MSFLDLKNFFKNSMVKHMSSETTLWLDNYLAQLTVCILTPAQLYD